MREEIEARVPQAKPRRTSASLEDLSLRHSLADGRSSCGRLPAQPMPWFYRMGLCGEESSWEGWGQRVGEGRKQRTRKAKLEEPRKSSVKV